MDALSLAQQLVRCESVTSSSSSACTDLLVDLLRQRGFALNLLDYRDAYGNSKQCISGVRSAGRAGAGLAFMAHSDVVSVDGWRTENGLGPFDAGITDGRMWGRGACDMKGPIAAALAAIDAIDPAQQKAPIYFFVTGDEECGMIGAQMLVQQCAIYRQMVASGSAAVVTEPTQMRVVNSHKGGCQFTVSAHGIAAHSSTSAGLNANWQLIPWLTYVREVAQQIESDPALRNDAFDPPSLSLNLVLKNQPTAYNITVGYASATVFVRTMPNTNWQQLVDQLTKAARDMELDVSAITALAPVHTSADSEFVKQTLQLVGQKQPDAVSYATDGCRYTDLSNLIVLGPGNIAQAHRCDEWISLEQLELGTEVYTKLLRQLTT